MAMNSASHRIRIREKWFRAAYDAAIRTALYTAAALACLPAAVGAGDAHLLLTEVCAAPAGAEFIEIWNPLPEPVGFDGYFLTDDITGNNNDYVYLATGEASPSQYDFLARFPSGSSIESGEVVVIAMDGSKFEEFYGFAPHFEIRDNPENSIRALDEGCEDCIGSLAGLTDDHEVIILFTWDEEAPLVEDVDICLWGDGSEAVDKTGLSVDGVEYLPDTPPSSQEVVRSRSHASGKSFQRLYADEGSEKKTGGNGLQGHDETSEPLSATWSCEAVSSPACFLPIRSFDLAIQEGSPSVSPAVPVAGFEMIMRSVVLNEGGEEAASAQVEFYLDGGLIEPVATVPPLLPGEMWEHVSSPFSAPAAGLHTAGARVVFALDEDDSDNEAFVSIKVISPGGSGPALVINEVMANPAGYESGIPGGKSDEYVELFNADTCAIDLDGWMITDGDDLDTLVSWSEGAGGETGCPACQTSSTTLSPGSYALVLDRDYSDGSMHYRIPAGTLLLTVKDDGPGESGYGLSAGSDPLVLYSAGKTTTEGIVSTWGTPVMADEWRDCDDNGLDDIPFEPRDGRSVERLDPCAPDSATAWVEGPDGGTPGSLNSRVPADTDLFFCIGAIEANPPDQEAGEQIIITAEICNGGSGDHPGGEVLLYLDGKNSGTPDGYLEKGELVAEPSETGSLPENGAISVEFTILPPGTGRFRYYAKLPVDDRPENNLACVDITVGAALKPVVINEYMNNPPTGGTEWIELLNVDTVPVDLRNWKIGDAEGGAFFFPDSETVDPVLAPDCFFIVCSDMKKFSDTHPEFPPGAQVTEQEDWLSLSVDEDVITLFDAAGFCVETVSYRSEWEGDRDVEKGMSWERIDPLGQSSDGMNWWGSTDPSGSTPGRRNSIRRTGGKAELSLKVNPNPFSPDGDGFQDRAFISILAPPKSLVTLAVYDAAGRRMTLLLDEEPATGGGVYWDGGDSHGRGLPIGIYILHVTAAGEAVREAAATCVIAHPLN